MDEKSKLVSLEQVGELLKNSKNWTSQTISSLTDIVTDTIGDLAEEVSDLKTKVSETEGCECEVVEEDDFNDMILNIFSNGELPTVSLQDSGFSWVNNPGIYTEIRLDGDTSCVTESGVIYYNGEDAESATLETVIEKGVRTKTINNYNNGWIIDNDLGNGIAYAAYATVQVLGVQKTIYSEEFKYDNLEKMLEELKTTEPNCTENIYNHQVPETGRESFAFHVELTTDTRNTVWDVYGHTDCCLMLCQYVSKWYGVQYYHANNTWYVGFPDIYIDASEQDEDYWYQWCLGPSYQGDIKFKGPKHMLTWSTLVGGHLHLSLVNIDSVRIGVFDEEYAKVTVELFSKNQAYLTLEKEPEGSLKSYRFYISDKVENPYSLLPADLVESSAFHANSPSIYSEEIHFLDEESNVIVRKDGYGVYAGSLLELNHQGYPVYFTTKLVHITADEFDSYKGV